MITLDLDIAYLCSRYSISPQNVQEYKKENLNLKEIVKVEAEQGNIRAAEMLARLTSNPDELSHLFQLVNPMIRYMILSNMNQNDLLMIIQFLDPDEMVLGLSIFNKEILTKLMLKMDIESLAKVVLSKMEPDKFLQIIPEEFLNEFLASDKLNRDILMYAITNLDEDKLQKMMENYTGQSCYESKDDILQKMYKMSDDDFMKSVFSLERDGKQQLISNLLREDSSLFTEFSAEAMVFPFQKMQKEEVLTSLSVLKTKDMIPMIEKMPSEILSVIATQIDPNEFAKILCSDFADVIANCGLKF